MQVGFPGQAQPSYAPQPQLGGEWGAAPGAMGAQPTLGFPQAAPQPPPQLGPPQAASGWGQAQTAYSAPMGVSAEEYMQVQEQIRNEQQIMQQHLEAQQNLAMQSQYEQAQEAMKLSGMMEGNLDNAAQGISQMASSIGDMNVGGDQNTKSSDTSTTSTTSTPVPTSTSGANTAVNMNDLSPTNLQNTMDMHMQHMQMPTGAATSFGGSPVTTQGFGGHFSAATGAPTTSPHFTAIQGATPQMVQAF